MAIDVEGEEGFSEIVSMVVKEYVGLDADKY